MLYQQFEFPYYYLRERHYSEWKKILTGGPLKYRGGCARCTSAYLYAQLRAKLALCADAMHRLVPRYPYEETILRVSPWFSLSFSLFLYLYPSWSFIHRGIAPICSCERFARDIQSMTAYASEWSCDFRPSCRSQYAVRIFTDYIVCVII